MFGRRKTAGHGVTWNDKHPTEANGALWPRPYMFHNTKRIKLVETKLVIFKSMALY